MPQRWCHLHVKEEEKLTPPCRRLWRLQNRIQSSGERGQELSRLRRPRLHRLIAIRRHRGDATRRHRGDVSRIGDKMQRNG